MLLFFAQPGHWYPVASIFCKYASYRGLLGTNSIFKKCFVVDKMLIGKNLTKLKDQLSGWADITWPTPKLLQKSQKALKI